MNHPEKSYEDMTVEELQQELREAFLDTDILDEPLNEELEKLREALNRKRPVEYLYTPEESWARFLEKWAEEEELVRSGRTAAQIKDTAKPRRYRAILRTALIAAAVVVLLAGAALAADSLGLWAWVPRWNAAAGRYEPAAQEVSGESPIPAALAELGITEPVYPTKLPEGFVLTESHISEDPLVLMEQYARGNERLSITVTPIKGVKSIIYQKSGKYPQEYRVGNTANYIFENEEAIIAVWYTKNYATTVSGNIPLEEMETIIDSLYGIAEGGNLA